jgi:hypothetical protein
MSNGAATAYTALWCVFVLVNLVVVIRRRAELALFTRDYVRFLAAPWKLVTFAVAWGGFVLIGPYSGDPTWDWFDASFMSVLTFTTAPWSVGVLVRVVRGWLPRWQLAPAVALWLLSASWLYDVYIWARDDRYPVTWSSNLVASTVLYACAGLLWSLSTRPGRPVTFAFLEADWLAEARSGSLRMWFWIAVFVLFVMAVMSPFLLEVWDRML